jgi:hypothetical protein
VFPSYFHFAAEETYEVEVTSAHVAFELPSPTKSEASTASLEDSPEKSHYFTQKSALKPGN